MHRTAIVLSLLAATFAAQGCEKKPDSQPPAKTEKAEKTEKRGVREVPLRSESTAAKGDPSSAMKGLQPPGSIPVREPAAVASTVDGVELSEGEVARAATLMGRSAGMPVDKLPPQAQTMLRARALEQLENRLLLAAHAKKQGAKVEPAAVKKKFDDFLAGLPMGMGDEDVKKITGKSSDELREEMAVDMAIEQVIEKLKTDEQPDDAALRAKYEADAGRWNRPEQASASHILLRLPKEPDAAKTAEAEKRAEELAAQARKGDAAAFAKLADAHSEDPSAKRNHGDLGFFARDQMVPAFATVAFALKKGEVGVAKTRFGVHVIRGQGVKPAGTATFEEVREGLIEEMSRAGISKRVDGLIAELRKSAKIVRSSTAPKAPTGMQPAMPMPKHPGGDEHEGDGH